MVYIPANSQRPVPLLVAVITVIGVPVIALPLVVITVPLVVPLLLVFPVIPVFRPAPVTTLTDDAITVVIFHAAVVTIMPVTVLASPVLLQCFVIIDTGLCLDRMSS